MHRLFRRKWKALAGFAAVIGLVAVAVVYGQYEFQIARWGCPSQAELDRLRTPAEVEAAFDKSGLELGRTTWPLELRRARAYRDLVVLRHDEPGATLFVVVCEVRCEVPRSQIRPGLPRRRIRFGFSLGNNVAGWIAGDDRHATSRLRRAISEPGAELDTGVDPNSRCYIG